MNLFPAKVSGLFLLIPVIFAGGVGCARNSKLECDTAESFFRNALRSETHREELLETLTREGVSWNYDDEGGVSVWMRKGYRFVPVPDFACPWKLEFDSGGRIVGASPDAGDLPPYPFPVGNEGFMPGIQGFGAMPPSDSFRCYCSADSHGVAQPSGEYGQLSACRAGAPC